MAASSTTHLPSIVGVLLIERPTIRDERGWFRDAIRRSDLDALSISDVPLAAAQVSVSHSRSQVVRGIHYSVTSSPGAFWQSVTCIRGRVQDVLMDLRIGSPTFGNVFSTALDPEAGMTLVMPPGVGHGFRVLEEESTLLYTMSVAYPEAVTRGIRPDFGPAKLWDPGDKQTIISIRDQQSPDFEQASSQGLLPTWTPQDRA